MSDHLVVVGASLAGLRAVEAARRTGFTGPISLIGAESHLPYDRPPLSKAYLDKSVGSVVPESTEYREEHTYRSELNVNLILGSPATALDIDSRTVTVGNDHTVAYDSLVIATGARARRLPGTEHLTGVHTLRTVDDADAVRKAMDAGAQVVVIGAGFIGSEVAASARKRGLTPTVIEAMPTPLVRAVGDHMGAALAGIHIRNGTDLRCGVGVSAVEGDSGAVERVILADGTVIPADLVVIGAGADPSVEWLVDSGLTLDNGVVCDETLSTGVDGVYAAGDVARWFNPLFGRSMRLEHWTSAAEQGAAAARNALDPQNAASYSTVPYFWSDWYDSRIQFVGSPEADEIVVVDGDLEKSGRLVALYRDGDRIVGTLTVNGQTEIMKYRRLIDRDTSWSTALSFAKTRAQLHADKHVATN